MLNSFASPPFQLACLKFLNTFLGTAASPRYHTIPYHAILPWCNRPYHLSPWYTTPSQTIPPHTSRERVHIQCELEEAGLDMLLLTKVRGPGVTTTP